MKELADAAAIDPGVFAANTGFMILCSGLVFLMLPGLSLFFGGLVQNRNILSTTMHSYAMLGIGSVFWAAIGYSLAFGADIGGVIGGAEHALLGGVGATADGPVPGIPHVLFMTFQCMIACLTPALISGAYAERTRFPAMALFSALWLLMVYSPLAHWVWGGGWLQRLGALDFAGGAVVHMSSGAAALAAAHVLGRRKNLELGEIAPHNLPLTILGAGLLWLGWFGFNSGGAYAANAQAASAMAATQLSAASGLLGWLFVETLHYGKPTTFGAASGVLAGLVSITPAAGFVEPASGLAIGFVGGMLCYGGMMLKLRFRYDDALDVVAIHGVGGTWGALATGIWATAAMGGVDGLLRGNAGQMGVQCLSIAAAWLYCYAATRVALAVTGVFTKLRADEPEQLRGLDLGEHNERAYNI
ncbi:MAG: ammonium transporter [Planctomycetota bacterium]|jgi:Amt family ammonium transporter|nr:ammonium transporter [Planctomycetota bacterium]